MYLDPSAVPRMLSLPSLLLFSVSAQSCPVSTSSSEIIPVSTQQDTWVIGKGMWTLWRSTISLLAEETTHVLFRSVPVAEPKLKLMRLSGTLTVLLWPFAFVHYARIEGEVEEKLVWRQECFLGFVLVRRVVIFDFFLFINTSNFSIISDVVSASAAR
jgi:hypothetical protein